MVVNIFEDGLHPVEQLAVDGDGRDVRRLEHILEFTWDLHVDERWQQDSIPFFRIFFQTKLEKLEGITFRDFANFHLRLGACGACAALLGLLFLGQALGHVHVDTDDPMQETEQDIEIFLKRDAFKNCAKRNF